MKRKEVEKGKKSSKKLVTVVMAAMIVSLGLAAFIQGAAAGSVTAFTVTPSTGTADAISAYTAIGNTTGFTTLNITIPKGFRVANDTMGATDIIATIDVYNATGTHGTITIRANASSDKVDVTAMVDGVDLTGTVEVDYTAGATTSISHTYNSYYACVNLTLPTESNNGSFNISVPAELNMTNCSVSIQQFIRNPADAGDYSFVARADGESVGKVATVAIGKVIDFTIKPSTGTADAISAYTAIGNTTGFTTLNITIPKGFRVANDTMGATDIIATIDVYNATGTHGTITIRANASSDKVDVTAMVDGVDLTGTVEVDYTAGATTSISHTYNSYYACVNLTLPTESNNGSFNISVPAELNMTNCSVSIQQFIRNPADAGDYNFIARADGESVGKVATVSIEIVTPTPTPPRGGGGAPVTPVTVMNTPIDPTTGAVTSTTKLTTEKATLTIPEGTIVKDAEGNPLSTSITMLHSPTTADTVGAIKAYDFGPSGTTFSPSIDLVIAYDPAEIPAGFSESDLVIKMYDGTAKAWIDLPTTVDTVTHTATAKVSHFSIFALFAAAVAPPPVITPKPTIPPVVTPIPPPVVPPVKRPWGLIIGIIIAVVIVGAAAYYFYTKKKA